jgi:two-component system, LuxR family, response regulator FixJ
MAPKAAQVYVIDHDAASRDKATALVRKLGFIARSFDSTESFLSEYDERRPTCIVADMGTPGKSGIDLLLELRSRGLTIPVIILTAPGDTRATVLAMKSGAFTSLDKPCDEYDLKETVHIALHEDKKRSEEDKRRHEARYRLNQLTTQERNVLRQLLAGTAHKVIALRLKIGLRTVEARRKSLFEKAKVDSIAELVKLVMLAEPDWLPSKPPG